MAMEVDSAPVEELMSSIELDRFNITLHEQLVKALRAQGDPELLDSARSNMIDELNPSLQTWEDWINDELSREDFEFARAKAVCESAVKMIPHPRLWCRLLRLIIDNESDDFSTALNEITSGVISTKYFMSQSSSVWNLYRDFLMAQLEKHPDKKTHFAAQLKAAYQDRLKVPHTDIEQTFNEYSSFITQHFNDNYESEMVGMNSVVAGTRKLVEERESWEQQLVSNSHSTEAFAEYIAFEKKKLKKKDAFVEHHIIALYEEALFHHQYVYQIWDDYLLYLFEHQMSNKALLNSVSDRATKNCIGSGPLWAHAMRVTEQNYRGDMEAMLNMWSQISENPYLNDAENSFDNWAAVQTAWLSYLHRVSQSVQEFKDELISACSNCVEVSLSLRRGSDNSEARQNLLIFVVELLTAAKQPRETVRDIWNKISKLYARDSMMWLTWFKWEQEHGDHSSATLVVDNASKRNLDWPQLLVKEYVAYEQLHGSPFSINLAMARARAITKKAMEKHVATYQEQAVQHEIASTAQNQDNEIESEKTSKRKHQVAPSPHKKPKPQENMATRDREHNSVIVSHLPVGLDETALTKFFGDCGQVENIRILESFAIIEFSSIDSALSALTKDKKVLGGNEIEVSPAKKSLLWVTNFTPQTGIEEIRMEFEQYGPVLDIRMPSLKSDTSRRFCYVQMLESSAAEAAIKDFSQQNYKAAIGNAVIVKLSDPSQREIRHVSSVDEGREIVIKNLDFKISEEELELILSKYGTVSKIVIPKKKGKPNGYAFVTFESNESAAIAQQSLDNTHIGTREAKVEISKPHRRLKPQLNQLGNTERQHFSVRVSNLPPSTTDQQLLELFKSYGTVVSVDHAPNSSQGVVVYDNEASVGKAAMALNGSQLNGSTIRVSGSNVRPQATRRFVPRAARR